MTTLEELVKTRSIITITGPAGCGKTRLAVEVARRVADSFDGYVVWVSLMAVASPELIPQTVASALGVRERGRQSLVEALSEHLRDKTCLIVVDDCDHHAKTVGCLAVTLTRVAPGLRILATSRELLGVQHESIVPLLPLAVPPDNDDLGRSVNRQAARPSPVASRDSGDTDALLAYDAVTFFVEQARRACPDFELTPETTAHVGSIVRRLDGLPLALELAAARLRALSISQLDAGLDDCLGLLTAGDASAPTHHQTLAAAIGWSYTALSPSEQARFRSLSIFAGGFSLEAANAVAGDSTLRGAATMRKGAITAQLCQLVDKSLVALDRRSGRPRYTILGLLAQYGREQLAADPEASAVRLRHARYYLDLAERLTAERDALDAAGLETLDAERDNLRAAMDTFVAIQDREAALRLACSLQGFWEARGYVSEGRRCLRVVLGGEGPLLPLLQARALEASGALAHVASDYAAAAQNQQHALALWEAAQDKPGIARCSLALALLAKDQGRYAEATQLYARSLALFEKLSDQRQVANVLTNMGILAHLQGDYRLSTQRLEASVALYRQIDDLRGAAYALSNLGLAARNQGHYAWSKQLHDEALALRRAVGDELGVAYSLANLGMLAQNQGQLDDARAWQEESLASFRRLGHTAGAALLLSTLAQTALYQGELAQANALGTEGLALYRSLGNAWGIATALHSLAAVAAHQGDETGARAHVMESLLLRKDLADRHGIAECLEVLACMEAGRAPGHAHTLVVLAEELRRLIPAPRAPVETAYLRARLGELPVSDAQAERLIGRAKNSAATVKAMVDFAHQLQTGMVVKLRPAPSSDRVLRQALHHLNDLAYLQHSPLAESLASSAGARLTGRAVQALVLEAIDALRPGQREGREERLALYYELLRGRFVDEDSLQDVLRRLGLSERQYYRELNTALPLVLEALHERGARVRAS